jgi:hypothetical protein
VKCPFSLENRDFRELGKLKKRGGVTNRVRFLPADGRQAL